MKRKIPNRDLRSEFEYGNSGYKEKPATQHDCKPPGFIRRALDRVTEGTVWECSCGATWMWLRYGSPIFDKHNNVLTGEWKWSTFLNFLWARQS